MIGLVTKSSLSGKQICCIKTERYDYSHTMIIVVQCVTILINTIITLQMLLRYGLKVNSYRIMVSNPSYVYPMLKHMKALDCSHDRPIHVNTNLTLHGSIRNMIWSIRQYMSSSICTQ